MFPDLSVFSLKGTAKLKISQTRFLLQRHLGALQSSRVGVVVVTLSDDLSGDTVANVVVVESPFHEEPKNLFQNQQKEVLGKIATHLEK